LSTSSCSTAVVDFSSPVPDRQLHATSPFFGFHPGERIPPLLVLSLELSCSRDGSATRGTWSTRETPQNHKVCLLSFTSQARLHLLLLRRITHALSWESSLPVYTWNLPFSRPSQPLLPVYTWRLSFPARHNPHFLFTSVEYCPQHFRRISNSDWVLLPEPPSSR
jgi:hypothetical protein